MRGESEKLGTSTTKERLILEVPGHTCEAILWHSSNSEVGGTIIYVPGFPGDTLESFGDEASRWTLGEKGFKVYGLIHSGIEISRENTDKLTAGVQFNGGVVNGEADSTSGGKIKEVGVTSEDWVEDVKTAIVQAQKDGLPITIVSHSLGGLFALTALAELIEEGSIDRFSSQIRFITVSSPLYLIGSLPDRKPLTGVDTKQSFTFYRDQRSKEAMSQHDNRIPMASEYAFKRIWRYLRDGNLIKVISNQERFNAKLNGVVTSLKNKAALLGKTDIPVIALFPRQDRWVSSKAGRDLQQMIGKPIIADSFDIPSALNQSMVEVNAHDLVDQWARFVYKYL